MKDSKEVIGYWILKCDSFIQCSGRICNRSITRSEKRYIWKILAKARDGDYKSPLSTMDGEG
jgi:hypothetical protein